MAVVIHRDPQLQKCLTKLRRAGGRALLAAEQVETILARLASHEGRHTDAVHKRTRHGEARIEKCKKFDLVGGYRLVYIHEAGYTHIKNLKGGLLAWADQVDPSMQKY